MLFQSFVPLKHAILFFFFFFNSIFLGCMPPLLQPAFILPDGGQCQLPEFLRLAHNFFLSGPAIYSCVQPSFEALVTLHCN